jgi:hypothetical protein
MRRLILALTDGLATEHHHPHPVNEHIPLPDCYEGRPLLEAFAPELVAEESAL